MYADYKSDFSFVVGVTIPEENTLKNSYFSKNKQDEEDVYLQNNEKT